MRPKMFDDEITRAAALKIVPALRTWLGKDADHYEDGELARDIANCSSYRDDGYEIARAMDRLGYAADSELVGLLDAIGFRRSEAHREAVKIWAAANPIDPAFTIGDRVKSETQGPGEVVDILRDRAQYLVKCDKSSAEQGYGGTYLNFEDVLAEHE